MIRTIKCTNGETCYAEECTTNGMCMHQDEATLQGESDPEYTLRIDAERVTLEFASKSPRRVDGGRQSIEDSPLFGGPRQASMFDLT